VGRVLWGQGRFDVQKGKTVIGGGSTGKSYVVFLSIVIRNTIENTNRKFTTRQKCPLTWCAAQLCPQPFFNEQNPPIDMSYSLHPPRLRVRAAPPLFSQQREEKDVLLFNFATCDIEEAWTTRTAAIWNENKTRRFATVVGFGDPQRRTMPRKQRADEAANIPLTTRHASSSDGLEGAEYHAALSALFKELCNIETNPNRTATQLVTVAVRLAVHVLGGCGVDVDAYLAKTCVLEAETGRPPAISLEDVMALWTAWEEEEERERAASGADAEVSAAVDATPDSSFRQFLRRFDLGRDVYGHWREEAHPNETLRADIFANVWEWMFRACMEEAKGDDDRSDTMETIEAFAMSRARKKRRNDTDGSWGECPAPSSGAAA
jgi:hypothetical protein